MPEIPVTAPSAPICKSSPFQLSDQFSNLAGHFCPGTGCGLDMTDEAQLNWLIVPQEAKLLAGAK